MRGTLAIAFDTGKGDHFLVQCDRTLVIVRGNSKYDLGMFVQQLA